MPIVLTLRSQEGRPLTFPEIDGNFTSLRDGLTSLEARLVETQGEGVTGIDVDGYQLTISGSKGSVWGPFTLPRAEPVYRGIYALDAIYKTGDFIFGPDGAGYMARADFTACGDFAADLAAEKLGLICQKGAAGPAGPSGTYTIRSQTYSGGGEINIDATAIDLATVMLGPTASSISFSGTPQDGQGLKIRVVQDEVGGRSVGFDLSKVSQGNFLINPPASTANRASYYLFLFSGVSGKWELISYLGDFA